MCAMQYVGVPFGCQRGLTVVHDKDGLHGWWASWPGFGTVSFDGTAQLLLSNVGASSKPPTYELMGLPKTLYILSPMKEYV